MMAVMSWVLAIPLLGVTTGLRTMTPMAVLCWFAYFGSDGGHLPLGGTWAFWAAKLVTAIVFTVLAVGELIGDKLPKTPSRTARGRWLRVLSLEVWWAQSPQPARKVRQLKGYCWGLQVRWLGRSWAINSGSVLWSGRDVQIGTLQFSKMPLRCWFRSTRWASLPVESFAITVQTSPKMA